VRLVTDLGRVRAFGSTLRPARPDELPTLLGVLRGDTSLVSPRPLLVQRLDRYRPEPARPHEVRSGMTCLVQFVGRERSGAISTMLPTASRRYEGPPSRSAHPRTHAVLGAAQGRWVAGDETMAEPIVGCATLDCSMTRRDGVPRVTVPRTLLQLTDDRHDR
jgi:hypothetical protein